MEYTITKEDFIGFWRDGGGEKFFFDDIRSQLIIDLIDDEMIKSGKSFDDMYKLNLIPMVSSVLRSVLGLSDEEIVMYLCDLLWLVLLAVANMYEDRYDTDVPSVVWVFDTPDHPFEQYLASKMPDVYEKYRTTPRTFDDFM
jgi:hypothetical protein